MAKNGNYLPFHTHSKLQCHCHFFECNYYLLIVVDGTVTEGIYFLDSVTVWSVTKSIYYLSRGPAEFSFIATAISFTICIQYFVIAAAGTVISYSRCRLL